jgi:3-oxoacyl-[acyl-carrier protein] reductase
MLVLEHFQPWEITENDLLNVYNTNVFGMALLTQEFLPQFKEQNSGNIINIEEPLVAQGSVFAHQNLQLEV